MSVGFFSPNLKIMLMVFLIMLGIGFTVVLPANQAYASDQVCWTASGS